ncbi:hypothetical protein ACET3Z_002843 [Daucus carota]
MGSKESERNLVVTQISVGGFDFSTTAMALLEYFENNVGVVWRCRLKTSSTPNEAYPIPDSEIDTEKSKRLNSYENLIPHAFVHFAIPDSAQSAADASGRSELILDKNPLRVRLGAGNPHRMNQMRRNKAPFKLPDVRIEIGSRVSKDEFFVAWRGPPTGADFLVDPFDGTCKFLLTRDTAFSFLGFRSHSVIKCNYKVEFLVRDIRWIKNYKDTTHLIVLLHLESSPKLYYRTADDDIKESVPFDILDDDDPWIRTTDFTACGAIGRCSEYRILIQPRYGMKLRKTMQYLKEQRVSIEDLQTRLTVQDEPDFGMRLHDPLYCIHFKEGINFKILFLVNALLHKGIFNPYTLSDQFFNLLKSQKEEVNIAALKHICSAKRPNFNACKRLKNVQDRLLKNPKLLRTRELDDIVEVRRLIITPTRAYCLPPEVELSNRVLRHYKLLADRFLRVTFMDDGMQTLNKNVVTYYPALIVREITSTLNPQKTSVFRRMKDIISEGFYLCGRKYSFLAFSANQLRDRSAWFFAGDQNTPVLEIMKSMGHFTNRNVAKCAARMGLCFSSTYATVEVPHDNVDFELADIKRNGYDFSDGIGKISHDLAKEVAERLQLNVNPPCAYQIRYGGCKGVVACWPASKSGIRLSLRQSMNKFESNHTILEICSWTRFQPGFLNRQIITLLSALNVSDNVFWNMQESMISKLNQMLVSVDVAYDVVTSSCGEEMNTAAIMLGAGFKPHSEPHLRGMLTSIRAAQFRDLREKARIYVSSGRWLMGCLDEEAILEQGQCFVQVSNPSLENCFAKHGSEFSETKKDLHVIKGFVVVAKNPCLHPGDVRILEAVDVPSLRHLSDCVVFPQKGDRPHTNEASGSDLDGDLYFVTWDKNLIPPGEKSWPAMDYSPVEVKEMQRNIKLQDVADFFAKNMVNESLGTICNAHVVHADSSDYGAMDENCILLAELAAKAVDFPKTGKIINMPTHLKPKLYPDFMEKEDFQSYKSTKILGRLYRKIKDDYDIDSTDSMELNFLPREIPYDMDLETPGSASFIDEAWGIKCSYDEQLNNLLGQYKVNKEEEVVTGHIWSMQKNSSKKQGELKERLKNAYNALKKEFRRVFEHMDTDFENHSNDEKNAAYERKASAWYQVTYHPKWVKMALDLQDPDANDKETVMLSFPWIASDYLARIKIKCGGMTDAITQPHKPIHSVARYLSGKI